MPGRGPADHRLTAQDAIGTVGDHARTIRLPASDSSSCCPRSRRPSRLDLDSVRQGPVQEQAYDDLDQRRVARIDHDEDG